jgi:hypothetical protein
MTIRRSGLRDSSHSGNLRDTLWLFPSWGGREIARRFKRPSATSTRAASMRSSAGVCTVVGSKSRAIAPGVSQWDSRGSKWRAATSQGERASITLSWPI